MTIIFKPIIVPDRASLRHFGCGFSAILAGLFGVLFPWLFNQDFPLWPWVAGVTIVAISITIPLSLGPFYRLWMYLGIRLGWLNTQILLSLIFFLILMPIGLFMRTLGRDAMARSFDQTITSYRSVAQARTDHKHMEKPF